jgi:transcriptional regulator with XRE-family HTH domain
MEQARELKQARKARGLSQAQVAALLGLSPHSGPLIGRWEKGEHLPSPKHAAKIKEVLDVELRYSRGKGRPADGIRGTIVRLENGMVLGRAVGFNTDGTLVVARERTFSGFCARFDKEQAQGETP